MIAGTVKNEPDPNKINQKAIFAMVALGVGELIGGQIIGQVVDRWGSKKASLVNVLLMVIQTAVIMAFLINDTYGWLAFATAFFWGLQDSALCTHSQQILGF